MLPVFIVDLLSATNGRHIFFHEAQPLRISRAVEHRHPARFDSVLDRNDDRHYFLGCKCFYDKRGGNAPVAGIFAKHDEPILMGQDQQIEQQLERILRGEEDSRNDPGGQEGFGFAVQGPVMGKDRRWKRPTAGSRQAKNDLIPLARSAGGAGLSETQ